MNNALTTQRKNWIWRLLEKFLVWERDIVVSQLDYLESQSLGFQAKKAERLADFDKEAAIHREHFLARIQIDDIELRCSLMAKRHRLETLNKAIKEFGERK